MLPPISNVAKASEIAAWKKKLAVSNCFRKLFEKIEDDENDIYMTKIIKNVWPKKKNIPNLQIAWAISISEIFLNPKNEVIKMSEEIIQPALARNLRKIENEEGFEYESDSSPTSQRPVSPERQKDPEKQIEPERNKGKKRSIEVETLRKNLKKSKRKVENNEYEGKKNDEYEGEEGKEGDEGEDDDDEDDEDEEGEDEEYHNEIILAEFGAECSVIGIIKFLVAGDAYFAYFILTLVILRVKGWVIHKKWKRRLEVFYTFENDEKQEQLLSPQESYEHFQKFDWEISSKRLIMKLETWALKLKVRSKAELKLSHSEYDYDGINLNMRQENMDMIIMAEILMTKICSRFLKQDQMMMNLKVMGRAKII
ncbi:hypothetical protein Glove_39g9 [Diversispora epigaea]|uniref:Uncharacterized protein n=1 Tax=Diversispora epigaea TaxID=1348612 RepID=A0A397JI04_9GLOM|nr:hypothetical protein Glove_39g9 [Diversispora epigaea]